MINIKNMALNLPRQYRTHKNADLPLDEYLEKYNQYFKKVSIGCSFAPDLVEQMYQIENKVKMVSDANKLLILKVLIHDFGMKDIRMGIKWNKAVDVDGKIDFSYYKKYLDYCLNNSVNVCLNIGPIKSFGWPEEYIPQDIIEKSGIKKESLITCDSKIAFYAIEYLDKLLNYLLKSYTSKQLENLVSIQPENETFNVYGKLRLKLSEEYIIQVIQKIHKAFPDKKILLSSAETYHTELITNTIKKLNNNKISGISFISGINYYYNLPGMIHLPKIGPIDAITITNMLQWRTHDTNIKNSRKYGFAIEVTEAQFEQWGRRHLSPGNSAHEARYLFARIAENILDPEKGGLIRLWGFERYAKKKFEDTLTEDHKENIKLIQKVNWL